MRKKSQSGLHCHFSQTSNHASQQCRSHPPASLPPWRSSIPLPTACHVWEPRPVFSAADHRKYPFPRLLFHWLEHVPVQWLSLCTWSSGHDDSVADWCPAL